MISQRAFDYKSDIHQIIKLDSWISSLNQIAQDFWKINSNLNINENLQAYTKSY